MTNIYLNIRALTIYGSIISTFSLLLFEFFFMFFHFHRWTSLEHCLFSNDGSLNAALYLYPTAAAFATLLELVLSPLFAVEHSIRVSAHTVLLPCCLRDSLHFIHSGQMLLLLHAFCCFPALFVFTYFNCIDKKTSSFT